MNSVKHLAVIAGAISGVVIIMAVLVAMVWLNNRQFEQRLEDLRGQHQAALHRLEDSRRAEQAAQSALSAQAATLKSLEAEVANLQSQLGNATNTAPTPRKALRARVYAGRQPLGDGWVFVGGSGTNGDNAEAAVSLDEQVLQSLVARTAKEIMARETPREVTVNHNYANPSYWGSYWPVAWLGRPSRPPSTNRPPSGGITPPPATTSPNPNNRAGAIGIWRPTQKPFLPNPSPWPGVTPPRASPSPSPRVNPALPASQPVLLP